MDSNIDPSEWDRDNAEHNAYDIDVFAETDSTAQSLQLEYEFDWATLSSTTTHRTVEYDRIGDSDGSVGSAYDGHFTSTHNDFDTWTEELRLVSNNTEGLRWVAGVYLDTEDLDWGPAGVQPIKRGTGYQKTWYSENESETMAVFGQTMIPWVTALS